MMLATTFGLSVVLTNPPIGRITNTAHRLRQMGWEEIRRSTCDSTRYHMVVKIDFERTIGCGDPEDCLYDLRAEIADLQVDRAFIHVI